MAPTSLQRAPAATLNVHKRVTAIKHNFLLKSHSVGGDVGRVGMGTPGEAEVGINLQLADYR